MKKIYAFIGLTMMTVVTYAQKSNVGIGTTKPDESAVLDVNSTSKGFLMPRMTLQQRNTIQNPAKGLIVYQTDMLSGFYYYNGTEWKSMSTNNSENSVAGTDGDWTLVGNAGTNPASNFVGTTDNNALVFRVNNRRAGYLGNNTNTYLGYLAGEFSPPGISNNSAFGTLAFASGSGNDNTAIGQSTMVSNTGDANVALGNFALTSNTSGSFNMAIGSQSLRTNTSGIGNVAIGTSALYHTTGSNGTAIGYLAGFNKNGTGNVYIGTSAGQAAALTSESNTLYISNTNTTTPLVYGDFATKYLAVGEVAAADRAAATSGGYRLLVKGGMITEKIKVAVAGSADWADYVFEPSYKLMSLDKVESFIKENKHLPNVPSAEDMSKNGLDVTQTSAKLMEKIEELTLYMIEMNKEIKALKEENAKLRNK